MTFFFKKKKYTSKVYIYFVYKVYISLKIVKEIAEIKQNIMNIITMAIQTKFKLPKWKHAVKSG